MTLGRYAVMDKSCLFVVFFFVLFHCCNRASNSTSLFGGRRSSILSVSRGMPRKIISVEGPSILFSAMGNPSGLQMCNVVCRASLQSVDAARPAMRKSSR